MRLESRKPLKRQRARPDAGGALPGQLLGVMDTDALGDAGEQRAPRDPTNTIVRREYAFNPKDRSSSSANAHGPMQAAPCAGHDTAKRFNVPFNQHQLMSDMVYNAN
jgi:soluble lytic murein transglycosylase-like protein